MTDSLNICLPCGLCCEGVILGFVQLDKDEVPVVRNLMNIEEVNGNGVFLQPCDSYNDGCGIYKDRPRQCASFKCGLLKSFEKKELNFETAIETIEDVKQKKIEIEKKIEVLQINLESKSFYFKIIELKRLLNKNRARLDLSKDYLSLFNSINQIEEVLLNKFDSSF